MRFGQLWKILHLIEVQYAHSESSVEQTRDFGTIYAQASVLCIKLTKLSGAS